MIPSPAIVIGGQQNGLSVIRNLGREGIAVYCLVDDPHDFAIYSKYCRGYMAKPGVETDKTILHQCLMSLTPRFPHQAYVHPTGDLSVLNLAELLTEPAIANRYVATVPPQDVVETMVFKKRFYRSLEAHQIPHPFTLYLDDPDWEQKHRMLAYPVFVKPSQSQRFMRIFPVKGFVASNAAELQHYLALLKHHNLDTIIQQIVQGPTTNQMSINGYFTKHSHPHFFVARQYIRQPTFFSVISIHVSIPLSKVAKQVALLTRYLSTLRYHGPFGAEFKKDARDNCYRLLEINARTTWYNTHLTRVGFPQVFTAYCEATGKRLPPTRDYDIGVYSINLLRDLLSLKNQFQTGEFALRDMIHPYVHPKHWLIYARDDLYPFIIACRREAMKQMATRTDQSVLPSTSRQPVSTKTIPVS
jgi:predicted ATP-grasp superfamily ATP-dependent carboligase